MSKLLKYSLLYVLCIIINVALVKASNYKDKPSKSYKHAVNLFDKKYYERALTIFLKLNFQDPDNCNLKFYIGVCYFFSNTQKQLSIPFLEEASKNITLAYTSNYNQKAAPIYTYYYLGQAYEYYGQYQKAINCFETYKNYLNSPKYKSQISEVNEHINICTQALKNIENQSKQLKNAKVNKEKNISEINIEPSFEKNINNEYLDDEIKENQNIQVINNENAIKDIDEKKVIEINNNINENAPITNNNTNFQKQVTVLPDKQDLNVIEANNFYVQVATGNNMAPSFFSKLPEDVYSCEGQDGKKRYISGFYQDYQNAQAYKNKVVELGFKDAWITKKGVNYKKCIKIK
ncbi:MAG TPA: hypothetical protein P5250_07060 [Bacteroidales bacterium]|nr:hypothetical protein [Bacteroidales bacterium]